MQLHLAVRTDFSPKAKYEYCFQRSISAYAISKKTIALSRKGIVAVADEYKLWVASAEYVTQFRANSLTLSTSI